MTPEFEQFFTGKSRFFSPQELAFLGASNTKGLNKLPPVGLWPNILPTLEQADVLRGFFGQPLRILSAYRSPEYNKSIDGATRSFHTKFMALDLTPVKSSPAEIIRLKGCVEVLIKRGQITGGAGRYSWGVHLDCGPRRDW